MKKDHQNNLINQTHKNHQWKRKKSSTVHQNRLKQVSVTKNLIQNFRLKQNKKRQKNQKEMNLFS